MHLLSHPMRAVLRLDQRLIKQTRQIVRVLVRAQDDVAAFAAVAAVGTASRHKFLAAKTDATTPAITGLRETLMRSTNTPNYTARSRFASVS